ncbi:hypothetical protein BDY19DRAFT_912957 [Irpex rosettiformis]|uniref:Uncharacterized protein n=1 Tax=Irpex rosettiformis TaxID=378272 RepID=A0ACB8UJN4_9APHY|nr:hypothetical protein BDY19DRAFT_912957 [Irpex rosettiformis]
MRVCSTGIAAFTFAATQVLGRAAYQLHSRDTTDVCAQLNGLLEVPEPFAGTVPVGFLSTCLCLGDIPKFMTSNGVAIAAVAAGGRDAAVSALTSMVNKAPNHKSCPFPDQAQPSCTSSNLCHFDCKNGFVPFPAPPFLPISCICAFPNKVCNGVCGLFKVCPSGKPKKRELDADEQRSLCPTGHSACGVYGFNSPDAWECVDTKSDLESCGGCTVGYGRNPAIGVDCTAIPAVMDVSCIAGTCAVQRCQPGFVVSANGAYCVRAGLTTQDDVPAALYGLEHVPLKKKSA